MVPYFHVFELLADQEGHVAVRQKNEALQEEPLVTYAIKSDAFVEPKIFLGRAA